MLRSPFTAALLLTLSCAAEEDPVQAEVRDVRVICRAIHKAFESQEMNGEGSFTESPLLDVELESAWGKRMVRELTATDPVPQPVMNVFVRRVIDTRAHEWWDDCAIVIAAAASTGDPDAMAAKQNSTNPDKRFRATASGISGGFQQ